MTGQSPAGAPQFQAVVDGTGYDDIAHWISLNPDWEKSLYAYGHVLFRNFQVTETAAFDAALDLLMEPSLEFSEETSPRSAVSARVFTSTDYPRQYPIQFHHEFSYRRSYPDRLAFCCLRSAAGGGATPLADARKVLDRIPSGVVEKFEKLDISYVRNFGDLGVSWQDAFGTTDKVAISDYCQKHDISYSWSGEDLHTSQTAPAVVTHRVTGERVWFNSALNLNVLGIEPEPIREAMKSLPASSLATNTTYGSGDPIEPEVLDQIRGIYADEAVRYDWQKGDLLLIDNILTAHARDPFEGDRSVVVGMGHAPAEGVVR
jgi:alpha-ketoglutarate-dependent taurine dioxygenase